MATQNNLFNEEPPASLGELPPASGGAMTVVSWNVNSLRSRLEHVLKFLWQHSPDVLCLQELKCDDKALPVEPFARLGYRIEAACQKTYNGVAIITPHPLTDVTRGFDDGDEDDPQARIIAATVRGVRILNLYVPNGSKLGDPKYDYKLGWMARMEQRLKREVADHPEQFVVVGDFNVATRDNDMYDPEGWAGEVLCSEPERAATSGWAATGLIDLFAERHPDGGVYSWWDYRAGAFDRNRGLRIDHIWATAALAEGCTDCEVIDTPRRWEKPSDHAPVTATFTLAEG